MRHAGLAISAELEIAQPQLLRRQSKVSLGLRIVPTSGVCAVSCNQQRLLQCDMGCSVAVPLTRVSSGKHSRQPSTGVLLPITSGRPAGVASALSFTQRLSNAELSGANANPAQLEASRQLATVLRSTPGLLQWTQAGAVQTQPSGTQPSSLPYGGPRKEVLRGLSSVHSINGGFDSIGEGFGISGMVLLAPSAASAATATPATGAASTLEEEIGLEAQPMSAQLQSLAALPQATRLLRLEEKVYQRTLSSIDCPVVGLSVLMCNCRPMSTNSRVVKHSVLVACTPACTATSALNPDSSGILR